MPTPNSNITYTALHQKVLIVATHRVEGTWKAYCVPVPGRNHRQEAETYWQENGVDIGEARARALFPQYSEIPYAL